MANSGGNQDLQLYIKNTLKKEINENDEIDLTKVSESWNDVSEVVAQEEDDAAESETDEIVYYTGSMAYANDPKLNKTIEIKLDDDDSTDVLKLSEDFLNENHLEQKDKLEVFDYNETVVTEGQVDEDDAKEKGTVFVLTDDKPQEIFKCQHCAYLTNKRMLLARHIKTHSKERPFKCSVCERGFKSNTALLNHTNSHLGKKPHHCKFCEMRFNTGGELARHMRYKHTHEKPHKCAECDYSSVELCKMRRHMRCHTGERPYQCPHCTYASPDTFKLKRHLRTHTGERPYECDICNARFSQSNSLKSHKLIHSVGERPVYQCTLCPTTCGRKTDLQLHIQKLHTSDHPIKCKRCGKELPDRYTYKVHAKTHEGEKCYRCSICPYASISQRHLDMHMLIHTDEKPFGCEHCGLTFRQRQLLMRHVNLYHNSNYVPPTPQEKNHICPHCRRAFLRKGNLMRHMEVHDTCATNDLHKMQLKIGRKMRAPANSSMLNYECQNDGINDNSANDSFIKTLEIINDDLDESVETKEETVKCQLMCKNSRPKTKKSLFEGTITSKIMLPNYDKTKLRTETKTSTSTGSSNVFITPSGSAAAAPKTALQSEHRLPIKIEIGPKDASDTDEGNEEFVVIEVIEEDGAADDEVVVSRGTSTILASKILEIPFQAADKQDLINTFGFSHDDEYILPVEIIDDD